MLREERQDSIVEMVNREKYVKLADLVSRFDVSKATIRRDLKDLSDLDRIRLTRGGAADRTSGTTQEPPYLIKSRTNHEEKIRIGQKAASLINRGETVILDSETTSEQIAEALLQAQDITVVTNDIAVAYHLAMAKNLSLTVVGGSLRHGYYSTQGYLVVNALENINADKAFIGVDALDIKKGCMITNDAEIIVKKLMMKAAKNTIIACDHSKFENVAFMHLCSLAQISMIITGSELDPAVCQSYTDAGVNIVLV
jgi:DeoR/GlpR family transcriptional regulator of sugar metabolism